MIAVRHLGDKRHPGLTNTRIEDCFEEVGDDDRPEPLIRCFCIGIEFDDRAAEQAVGTAEHGLKERALVLEMMQHHPFRHAGDGADLVERCTAKAVKNHRLKGGTRQFGPPDIAYRTGFHGFGGSTKLRVKCAAGRSGMLGRRQKISPWKALFRNNFR